MATIVILDDNIPVASIPEDTEEGFILGVLTIDGGEPNETYTFTLDDPRFEILESGGIYELAVKQGVAFDFENGPKSLALNIQVANSAGEPVSVQPVTIQVTNANEAPTDIILVDGGTIGDNAIIGATVAKLAGQDPDRGDVLTYTIVTDMSGKDEDDHPYFEIQPGSNEIVVKHDLSDALLEPMTVYVKVTDAEGLFHVKPIPLTVIPVNESPEVTADPREVLDGSKGGTLVAVVSAVDPEDGVLTYKLSAASAQWFDLINNNDGTWNVVVKQGVTLRSDRAAFQSFVVEVSDTAGNTTPETVDLDIIENLEPEATFEFLEVAKNAPAGTLVGTLVGYDPYGEAVSYTLTGESAGPFTLVKNASGHYDVLVKQGATLDYSDDAQRSFTVRVADGFNPPFEESFDLVFGSFAPVVTDSSSITVKEGDGGATVVAKFKVTDPDIDDTIDCSLSPESEALFDIVDHGNGHYDIVVREGVKLDYENPAHHKVRMVVSDGSNTVTKDFAINMTDEVDVITGTARADSLNGTAGRDIIKGLAGNDSLVGNTGNDTLYGGAGKDVLTGGVGQDVFVFDSKPNKKTNLDKIADFKVVDDSIWLENKIFTKLGKKGSEAAPAQLKKSFVVLGDKAKDKDDYIIYSKKTGKLFFDGDGSGSKAAVEIATLSKKLAMTNKDFFVI
ncbi:M10 family metallopeptidase C-terminal domain-containing protein [Microvirga soli]|uniref:M10 family metallopeptidase C-terminal domain-containing protein n=1 Tax=Microvirga soli TaxID=1854496 RepID=UPI00191D0A90|nr:calcium-binding protein [Microvirga soli]